MSVSVVLRGGRPHKSEGANGKPSSRQLEGPSPYPLSRAVAGPNTDPCVACRVANPPSYKGPVIDIRPISTKRFDAGLQEQFGVKLLEKRGRGVMSDRSLAEMLLARKEVTDVISEAEIRRLTDPKNYLGLSEAMTDRVLKAG